MLSLLGLRKAVPGSGGAGADTLTGGGGADTFNYLTGDASTLTFTAAADTADAPAPGSQYSNLEVITDLNFGGTPDKITLGNAAAGLTLGSVGMTSGAVGENDVEVVFGQYNSGTHTFTSGVTNGDAIVLWDGDAAGGVQLEAVVLVGVDLSKTAMLTGHDLTFA